MTHNPNPIETPAGRAAERDELLSLTGNMTAAQNLQVLLILGALNDLEHQAGRPAHHLHEHARPRVAGEERELLYNPGRAQLILDSLRQYFTVGARQIAGYLDTLNNTTPALDPAIIRRLELFAAATIAATHTLHGQLAAEHGLRLAAGPPVVVSADTFPSDALFPSSQDQE